MYLTFLIPLSSFGFVVLDFPLKFGFVLDLGSVLIGGISFIMEDIIHFGNGCFLHIVESWIIFFHFFLKKIIHLRMLDKVLLFIEEPISSFFLK